MKRRHIEGISKPRIRATGDAAKLGALIADRVPEIRVVGNSDTAEFLLLRAEELAEFVEDAMALAAYERTRGEETVPVTVVDRLLPTRTP